MRHCSCWWQSDCCCERIRLARNQERLLMSGESTITDSTNGSGSDAQMRGVGVNLAARRRESALLMALAIKSIDRSEIGRALPFLAITIALASMIPFALRISPELGLPGAPLIAAKIEG